MSLFIQRSEDRSELQKRIAAELTEKAKKKNPDIDLEPKGIDGVSDSAYIKDFHQSKPSKISPTWWVFIILTAITILAIVILITKGA